jgi:glucosamine-6-phosphate deaminase
VNRSIFETSNQANNDAADRLAIWLLQDNTRSVMPAAGNTPLALYRLIAKKNLNLSHLKIFTLDEYVGVPLEHPRNCTNLLRHSVCEAWNIPQNQFYWISSLSENALESVRQHEKRIQDAGGIDVLVLGLGQNGHLGFNEPASAEDSVARVVDLQSISVEANRQWFDGKYAPSQGVTVGLKTILSAKMIMILAYGPHKTAAARAMIEGPRDITSPASLLQGHQNVYVYLDKSAASGLKKK